MNSELLSAAIDCIRHGVSIIPIDHRTKKPTIPWKIFQSEIADESTVRAWFASGIEAFAVVGGAVSGGLLILDFDVSRFYEAWKAKAGNVVDSLTVQQTGGGGYQVLFRCLKPGGNEKLAYAEDATDPSGRTIAIETRGEGGYAIVAPSLHPSGNRYIMAQGGLAQMPHHPYPEKLLEAARSLNEVPVTEQERARAEDQALAEHKKKRHGGGAASVIDAFNAANPVEGVLLSHGYTRGRGNRYVRPGGKSESVSIKAGRSCHWSSNDPLNDGKVMSGCGVHDSFDVFAHFQHGGDCNAAVKEAAALLGISTAVGAVQSPEHSPWPDPLMLPAGLPPVMQLDFDLLPAALHGWVKDISERMQCPPDYCAATAMIVAGSLIGRKVSIRPKRYDDWQVVPNLFGMMVGRPSLMKSPAMQEVLKFPKMMEIRASDEHAKAMQEHKAKAIVAGATKRAKMAEINKAAKEGMDTQAIAEEIAKADEGAPTRQRYIVNDATIEKLGIILNENPNGVLLFVDELVSLLRSMDREGHEAYRGFYLTAWDGNSRYTYDRVERGTLDIEAAIVSVVGSIQPGVVADYLRGAISGGSGDDGMMQRFQMTVYPDPPGQWKNVDRYPDSMCKQRAYEALQRLVDLNAAAVDAERDQLNLDVLPFLRFDAAGQQAFDCWRESLEFKLRSGVHPAIESHLAKFRSLVPSLSLILHLLDGGKGQVPEAAVVKAIGWASYLESHARRLYSCVTCSPALAAKLLADRITGGEIAEPFATRDVYRKGWAGLDKDRAEAAIDVLQSLHWIEERVEATPGRKKIWYAINPKIVVCPRRGTDKADRSPECHPSVSSVSTPLEDTTVFSGAGDGTQGLLPGLPLAGNLVGVLGPG